MKSADILFNRVCKIMETILVSIFTILVIDVLLQVFSRYVLNTSFTFTEELARFSLIWLSILGAAYLNGKREHLSMDFLYQKFPAKFQKKVLFFYRIMHLVIFFNSNGHWRV